MWVALLIVAIGFAAPAPQSEAVKAPSPLLIVTGRPFRVFHPLGEALAKI